MKIVFFIPPVFYIPVERDSARILPHYFGTKSRLLLGLWGC